jgi:hypothetical protein
LAVLDKISCDKYSGDKNHCDGGDMHQNKLFMETAAQARAADLRRYGGTRRTRRAGPVRRRTGLLLVNLGLRLALR